VSVVSKDAVEVIGPETDDIFRGCKMRVRAALKLYLEVSVSP
jgi:hypothetical protein